MYLRTRPNDRGHAHKDTHTNNEPLVFWLSFVAHVTFQHLVCSLEPPRVRCSRPEKLAELMRAYESIAYSIEQKTDLDDDLMDLYAGVGGAHKLHSAASLPQAGPAPHSLYANATDASHTVHAKEASFYANAPTAATPASQIPVAAALNSCPPLIAPMCAPSESRAPLSNPPATSTSVPQTPAELFRRVVASASRMAVTLREPVLWVSEQSVHILTAPTECEHCPREARFEIDNDNHLVVCDECLAAVAVRIRAYAVTLCSHYHAELSDRLQTVSTFIRPLWRRRR